MALFTGSPWQVHHDEYATDEIIGAIDDATDANPHYRNICTVNVDNDDWQFNARLIAGAPEMYFMLRDLINWMPRNSGEHAEKLRDQAVRLLCGMDVELAYTKYGHSADEMPF